MIIFTKKALQNCSEGEEARVAELLKKINNNANLGISTTIVLEDATLSIDLIPRLAVQPEGRLLGVILGHQSFHTFHNYVNSYVDYLAKYYKGQIFA